MSTISTEEVTFCASIEWETDQAYLLSDGVNNFWVPKSQVLGKEHFANGDFEFIVPEWLAIDKGIV